MKHLILIFTFALAQHAFAIPPCLNGELAFLESTIKICRTTGRDFSWDVPSPQEWLGYNAKFYSDKRYWEILNLNLGMKPADFHVFTEGRIKEGKTMRITMAEGGDTAHAKMLVNFLNEGTGIAALKAEAAAQAAAEAALFDAEKAEQQRVAGEFSLQDTVAIAETNLKIMTVYKTQGCEAAVAAAKTGEPLRGLDFKFRDGETERILIVSSKKTATGYTIQFYGYPPRWNKPNELHTRNIVVQAGQDPAWFRPAIVAGQESTEPATYPFDPVLTAATANIGEGTQSGLCKLGLNAVGTLDQITPNSGEDATSGQ